MSDTGDRRGPGENGGVRLPRRSSSDRRSPNVYSFGRRRTDYQPRTTLTKKFVVIAVAVVNAVYLVSEVFLSGTNGCP